jgi:hypothetical protein
VVASPLAAKVALEKMDELLMIRKESNIFMAKKHRYLKKKGGGLTPPSFKATEDRLFLILTDIADSIECTRKVV